MDRGLHLSADETLIAQRETVPFRLGFSALTFCTEDGHPVNRRTGAVSEFFLHPSGGTLRDASINTVFHDSRFDAYRGFRPPHVRNG
jgi:hypothetical protein